MSVDLTVNSDDNITLIVNEGVPGSVSLDGLQTLSNKILQDPLITNGFRQEVFSGNTTASYTISMLNGSIQNLTLAVAATTYTFPIASAGSTLFLIQRQDATGSRTVSWPANVRWPGGTAPTLTATANRVDIFEFIADGSVWFGTVIGQNYTA